MLYASIQANIITGKPVPIANINGKKYPEVDETDSGIKPPKNNIPLYGQNASANTIPKNKEFQYVPFFPSPFFNFMLNFGKKPSLI